MRIKKISLIFLIYTLSLGSLHSTEPDVFVQSTVNRASQILSENISKKEKIIKLRKIARETVDIKGISLYSLGSKRKELNDIVLVLVNIIFDLLSVLFLTGVQQFQVVYDNCCKIVERRALPGFEVLHCFQN